MLINRKVHVRRIDWLMKKAGRVTVDHGDPQSWGVNSPNFEEWSQDQNGVTVPVYEIEVLAIDGPTPTHPEGVDMAGLLHALTKAVSGTYAIHSFEIETRQEFRFPQHRPHEADCSSEELPRHQRALKGYRIVVSHRKDAKAREDRLQAMGEAVAAEYIARAV